MQPASIHTAELEPGWSETDPSLRTRDAFLLSWQEGTTSSSVVYFEIEPGCHIGRHVHTAEEVVTVLDGEVELTVGEETVTLDAGSVAFAPPQVPHDVRCTSSTRARVLGFFPSATVTSIYDDELMPAGSRVQGTPSPDADQAGG